MRQSATRLLLPVCLAALLMAGCDNTFTPKGTFRPQLVVFCILDPGADMQVVRLAVSYDSEVSSNPVPLTPVEVDSAVVLVNDKKRGYAFTDTLIALPGGGQQRVWISRTLAPQSDVAYTLTVRVPGYDPVSVSALMPGKLYPWLKYEKPDTGYGRIRMMPGYANAQNPPYGYFYRMFVVFTRNDGGPPDETRMEVPASFDSETGEAVYAVPMRNSEVSIPVPNVWFAFNRLRGTDTVLVNKQLLVKAYAMDDHFYRYYKMVLGFDDPLTLRIDRPDLSFIPDGLGLFGMVNTDSMRFNFATYVK